MTDQTTRTPTGEILSFDKTPSGKFILNLFGAKNTFHVTLDAANMEELLEMIGATYYGSGSGVESSDQRTVRLLKQAIREVQYEDIQAKEAWRVRREAAKTTAPQETVMDQALRMIGV